VAGSGRHGVPRLRTGDPVLIRSALRQIRCVAEKTPRHEERWCPYPTFGRTGRPGANVNELTDDLDAGDAFTGIPT